MPILWEILRLQDLIRFGRYRPDVNIDNQRTEEGTTVSVKSDIGQGLFSGSWSNEILLFVFCRRLNEKEPLTKRTRSSPFDFDRTRRSDFTRRNLGLCYHRGL